MTEQTVNRTVTGKVVSNKMTNTIVVEVLRKEKHPLYGKYVRKTTKLYAHDAGNTSSMGDIVVIEQSRPLSKTKHWKLVEIIERAEKTEVE